ncbi:CDP-alcohol phosphatidyltransferase family protein [Micromonospora sp. KC721]|uniref:CDP-alcohol phosphatidyltransferase family protein n=1 Tax=Micromonospora sp. KC721 TaxID=2530380 RepID=UPI001053D25A|nr:CDP-alcohol phosphatidyltransferase family protein [Micromonospora sp. KC721]TDB73577.1 CDP-alcohol phosphatidyltransferase family protein [Micromonospora sp. KC721]
MSRVRTGPVIGLTAQIVLLVVLAATVGLDAVGWLAGVGYGIGLCVVLTRGLRRHRTDRLGPADRVTLARAVLVGGVTALLVDAVDGSPVPLAVLVPMTAVALALDAVDGWVARRTGSTSALGARFDMEIDSFLVLMLSVHVAPVVGPWVLVIGGARYAFVAASWVLPWMRGTLPPRYWRKVVAAAAGVLLLTATADVLPHLVTMLLLAALTATLLESFGRDVAWLWRHRPVRSHAPTPAAAPAATSVPVPTATVAVTPGSTPVLVPSRSPVPVAASAAARSRNCRPRTDSRVERPLAAHQPV